MFGPGEEDITDSPGWIGSHANSYEDTDGEMDRMGDVMDYLATEGLFGSGGDDSNDSDGW